MNDHSGVPQTNEAALLTVHDVARYLRLSEAKVYEMARDGRLPAFRLGKVWRFRKDLIDNWIFNKMNANPRDQVISTEA